MVESALAATWANPEAGTPLRAEPRWGMRAKELRLAGRWYRVLDISSGRGGGPKDWIRISLGHRVGWVRRTYLDFRFNKKPPTCRDGSFPSGWRPMPVASTNYFLWNVLHGGQTKNTSRAWGTCSTVEHLRQVLRTFHERHPSRARIGIGDISRRGGGPFPGHASHRRGVDVDLYYPRLDNREISTRSPSRMNRRLSQELINLFIRSGSRKIYMWRPRSPMARRGATRAFELRSGLALRCARPGGTRAAPRPITRSTPVSAA